MHHPTDPEQQLYRVQVLLSDCVWRKGIGPTPILPTHLASFEASPGSSRSSGSPGKMIFALDIFMWIVNPLFKWKANLGPFASGQKVAMEKYILQNPPLNYYG